MAKILSKNLSFVVRACLMAIAVGTFGYVISGGLLMHSGPGFERPMFHSLDKCNSPIFFWHEVSTFVDRKGNRCTFDHELNLVVLGTGGGGMFLHADGWEATFGFNEETYTVPRQSNKLVIMGRGFSVVIPISAEVTANADFMLVAIGQDSTSDFITELAKRLPDEKQRKVVLAIGDL